MKTLIVFVFLALFAGCGATIQTNLAKKDARLGAYQKPHIIMVTKYGNVSMIDGDLIP